METRRDYLVSKEVMQILGVCEEGLRRLLENGAIRANRLPIRTPGGKGRVPGTTTIRYDRQSVDDFKARRMTQKEFLDEARKRGVHVTPYYLRLWMRKGALVHGRDFIGRVNHRWWFPSALDVAMQCNPQLLLFPKHASQTSAAPVHA